ncbi:hypothetical protein [Pseudalkalibacillus sp. SCS-8]|uniref:hypothetical protein n=1 Tax=Pseudalkalibacillus nanhaiensis TaxID=3115291 RepID=UPI0032D9E64C
MKPDLKIRNGEFERSDIVFKGHVTSIKGTKVNIRPYAVLKGEGKVFTQMTLYNDKIYPQITKVDQNYLVYAKKNLRGYKMELCTASRIIEEEEQKPLSGETDPIEKPDSNRIWILLMAECVMLLKWYEVNRRKLYLFWEGRP